MSETFNLWDMRDDYLQWWIEWDHITERKDFHPLIAFAREFLEIGKDERIYWLVDAETGAIAHDDYIDYLQREIENREELPLFDVSEGPWYSKRHNAFLHTDRFKIMTHLCYFDQHGDVIEADVNDLGAVIKSVTPFDPNWHDPPVYDHFVSLKSLAIEVRGSRLTVSTRFGRPWLVIRLKSSIWFPRVNGHVLDLNANIPTKRDGMWDNHVLANCHTPRLNNFLRRVRALAESSGGRWMLDLADCVPDYAFMSEETGVKLDV